MKNNNTLKVNWNRMALVAMATVALAGTVIAQKAVKPIAEGQIVTPSAKNIILPAPPIDSHSFFPSVNLAQTGKNIKPSPGENSRLLPETSANGNLATSGENSTRVKRGAKFPGISFTGSVPPDPSIAVGPSHVVEVVNSTIAWYRKSDGFQQFQQPFTNTGFLAGVPDVSGFTFDPKAFYDHKTNRFFAVILDVDFDNELSAIVICVSDDDDPNGTWFRYRIDNNFEDEDGDLFWGDYPGFGFGDDFVICTTNLFPYTADKGSFAQFQAFPKGQLINNSPLFEFELFDPSAFTVQVARESGTTDGDTYATARVGTNTMRVYKIESNFGTPNMFFRDVGVQGGLTGGSVISPDGTLDAISSRMMDASVSNGKLVGAFTISLNQFVSAWVGVRWFELDLSTMSPTTNPGFVQAGTIQSQQLLTSYWMPAICVNDNDVVTVVCSRANQFTNPQMMFFAHKPSDPPGTMSAPVVVANSSGGSGGINRWGDYAGIGVDPTNEDRFWICAELLTGGGAWTTEIQSFDVPVSLETIVNVASVTPVIGATTAGNIGSFTDNDNDYYAQNSVGVPKRGQYSAYDLTFNSGLAPVDAEHIRFELRAKVSEGLAAAYVYLWSYTENRWVPLRVGAIRTTEGTEFYETLNTNGFVSNTGELTLRVFTLEPVRKVGAALNPYILSTDVGRLIINPLE